MWDSRTTHVLPLRLRPKAQPEPKRLVEVLAAGGISTKAQPTLDSRPTFRILRTRRLCVQRPIPTVKVHSDRSVTVSILTW